ncbi:homoserine dehydrogenase [Gimesia chilikensis]|uniref:homoserine dehydrogenase n=1 Tax=Gimesia chilikensis TaxID=2605989 RepID=UPI0011EEAFAB|nr:homoserine dehydrogenase [Gimesia chilikensis]KAA0138411.1 homoserine dehydrogenase [Gimesia chilikensis]
MSSSPLNVAIIGMGTVGSGVAKILLERAEQMTTRAGRPIHLKRAVVRDLSRPRDIELAEGVLTDDIDSVLNDDSIDVIIQLVGGIDPAYDIMLRALESGKDVVTANKALLCEKGESLYQRARELGRCICFEAAVAGGVPLIETVTQAMSANQITSIEAILNGTSNYILTQMFSHDVSYDDAVKSAQEIGYAEADPAMDVDGTDAAQKLGILVQLSLGIKVSLDQFLRQGIDTLSLADLKYADELGYTVKLLAVANLIDGQLEMHAQPTLIRNDNPLAHVEDAYNKIALEGDAVGKIWLSGMGAGQMATASAVVANLIDVAVGRAALTFPRLDLWNPRHDIKIMPREEISRRYFLRLNVEDRPHVLADITNVLGDHEISIASLVQHEAPEVDPNESYSIVPLVIMTHQTTEGRFQAASRELEQLTCIRSPFVRMPVND